MGITENHKIAIVHDWLITVGGAEKVLSQLIAVYPNAEVFCLFDFFNEAQRTKILHGKKTNRSLIQKIPFAKRYYRFLLPLMYKKIEHFDFSEFDIIISSSHAVAKNIQKNSNQIHFCYCHTPMRYVWNMKKTYLNQLPRILRGFAFHRFNKMRDWDLSSNSRVDYFIANSAFVAGRIEKNYQRESVVIHPPVNVDFFNIPGESDQSPLDSPYFLVVSRLVKYKRVDLIVNSFNNQPDKKLVVIGEGPHLLELQNMANENIEFINFQSKESVRKYMQFAEAIVMAAIEDFGITSLEAQACGTPVIALNFGGYKETVIHNETGLLYFEQSEAFISKAVEDFCLNKDKFDRNQIRKNTIRFGTDKFKAAIKSFVEERL